MFTTPALAPCGPRAVPGLKDKALSDARQSPLPFYFGDGHRRPPASPAALDQAPGPSRASQPRPQGQMCGSPGTPLRKGQTFEWTEILRTLTEAGVLFPLGEEAVGFWLLKTRTWIAPISQHPCPARIHICRGKKSGPIQVIVERTGLSTHTHFSTPSWP